MYEVKAINESEEIYLNIVSTELDAPRITGTIKQGINVIDSFTFTIYPNHQAYNSIHPFLTKITVFNTKTHKYEFVGRVLMTKKRMESSGLISTEVVCESELGYLNDSITKYGEYHDTSVRDYLQIILDNHNKQSSGLISTEVVCESELGYLNDSITKYGEYHDTSVRDYLQIILDNHNKQVSEDKQFQVGIVEVEENLYRYLGYDKTFTTIKDKLLDRLGGELRVRYDNGIRYLDYLTEVGEVKKTDIRLAKNLITIEQEQDPSEIISRLIPLGTKLDNGTEERLTISEINGGINYIDDEDAIAKFGIIVDSQTWDDVAIAENLLDKAKKFQKENNRIKKAHKLSALDLSLIGLDIDSFELGNYHPVINPLMDIDETLRIIELSALDLSLIGLDIDSFELGNYHPVINPLMDIDETLRIIEKSIIIESPESSTLLMKPCGLLRNQSSSKVLNLQP